MRPAVSIARGRGARELEGEGRVGLALPAAQAAVTRDDARREAAPVRCWLTGRHSSVVCYLPLRQGRCKHLRCTPVALTRSAIAACNRRVEAHDEQAHTDPHTVTDAGL